MTLAELFKRVLPPGARVELLLKLYVQRAALGGAAFNDVLVGNAQ